MGRLFLWDIDGTLLTASGVSRAALYAAVKSVTGRAVSVDIELQTAGKTDPEIARDLLTVMDVAEDEMAVSLKKVLRAFGPELAARRKDIATKGQIFPGVRAALTAIEDTSAVNTVLTGNIAVNAICKLDAFRLTPYFDLEVGAFGSDHHDRTQLVDVVLGRVATKRNRYFADDEIWIIGDTPLDFAVAAANHTHSLLVATGHHSLAELEGLGADLVLPDLSDTEQILKLLQPRTDLTSG